MKETTPSEAEKITHLISEIQKVIAGKNLNHVLIAIGTLIGGSVVEKKLNPRKVHKLVWGIVDDICQGGQKTIPPDKET